MPLINRITKKKIRTYTSPQRALRARYYSSQMWREMRIIKLNNNPLCEVCQLLGVYTPATQVHHLQSPFQFADSQLVEEYFYNFSNLQSICPVCHGKEHAHTR